MSTSIKTNWLKDKSGQLVAPRTLISQVQTNDGKLLEQKIQDDISKLQSNIKGSEGIKVSQTTNGVTVELDDTYTLIFNCGTATTVLN